MRRVSGPLSFQTAAYRLHAYLMLHWSNDIGEWWGEGRAGSGRHGMKLLQWLQRLHGRCLSLVGDGRCGAPVEPDGVDETNEDETREPAAKRSRMEYDDPFGWLEALLEADPVGVSQLANVEEEIAAYLDQSPIPPTSCVRTWWRENESRFPGLARVARRYLELEAPSTSVASERLFRSAGNVFTDQSSWLAADRAEMIIMVKHNLRALDYDY